ncbi:MAG: glycosyltransferase, partial [Acidimicrobiales bacterium]|nr:glycosyltransferase [Acidimicrobiales bacterium]
MPVGVDGDAWADRANALVASAEEERIAFWRPHETWSPRFLDSLLAAVNDGSGAYGAVVEAESDLVRTELGPQETLIWRPARGLAGMLVSRSALQEVPFRVEAGDQYGWDHLLRSSFPRNFVPFIAARDTHASSAPLPPGVMTSYEHVIRAERIIDWDLLRERATERIESRVSLLVPTFRDWRYTATAVATALNTGSGDMEVVVLDNGSSRNVSRILTALTAADRRVQVRRVACNTNFATGSNLAFAASTGARVVFLNNDTDPREGWLEPLVSALDDPTVRGAQPLLLYPDDSVQTAGTVFHGPHLVPSHFLTSHPREDVPSAQKLRFHAVTAACLAMRADTVAAARGFDPHFVNGMEDVDLCLRLGGINDKVFVTVTDSQVAHHESKSLGRSTRNGSNRLLLLARWGARLPGPEKEPWTSAGFEVVAAPLTGAVPKTSCRTAVTPILRRLRTSVSAGNAAGLPRLRWAIKIAAPGGPRGNGWGDVAF